MRKQLSAMTRIAVALEKQTVLLEALHTRQEQVENTALLTRNGREVQMTFVASSVAMGQNLYGQMATVIKQLEEISQQEPAGGKPSA